MSASKNGPPTLYDLSADDPSIMCDLTTGVPVLVPLGAGAATGSPVKVTSE